MSAMLRQYPLLASLVLLLLILTSSSIRSQTTMIENAFTSAHVAYDQKSGRFWIGTGRQHGYTQFLYKGSSGSTTITSNLVFRVQRGSITYWYTNVPLNNQNGGFRPQGPNGPIDFAPYDSMYVSPGKDTIEVIYRNLNIYAVTVRYIAEKPRHVYDDGADIVMEFDYKLNQAVSGSGIGIFMMLDIDNGTVPSGSDRSSIMTDRGYLPSNNYGAVFQKNFGGIPEYYHAGFFDYTLPVLDVFSVHRLTGKSLGGKPLTTPDELAIGRWHDFRSLSWFVNSDVTSKVINDAATLVRWGDLTGNGIVRTAFGTTSNAGNNFHTCRDSNIFVTMRTERVVTQQGIGGQYQPATFDVEMWVTNLHRVVDREISIGLQDPIQSAPFNTSRLRIDPSTPAIRDITLNAAETQKLTWRVTVNQTSRDSIAMLRVLYRDTSALTSKPLVPLLEACTPLVSFIGAEQPPPYIPDTRPPVIEPTGNGRDITAWWTFRTFDRHAGYTRDTGIDKIEIIRNDGNNVRLIQTPSPFTRCDTNVTVTLRAEVIDTARPGHLTIRVTDCKGNQTETSAVYSPRPDTFVPEVMSTDTTHVYDPTGYPCAVKSVDVFLRDSANQSPSAGDLGFGSVELLSGTNIQPLRINVDRGDVPIAEFDRTASFRIEVIDTLLPSSAIVRIADVAGNADTLTFDFCTIPDRLAPVVTAIAGTTPGTTWVVTASDKRSWDRGLSEIVEISRTNMSVTPWPISIVGGEEEISNIAVAVDDDAWPAEVTLEVRDRFYVTSDPTTHAAHATRIQLTYGGVTDTMPPNIIFTRDLTVPPTEVVFNVAVNDSHTVAGDFYRYDRGLETVTWTMTPNMRVRTPIVFFDNRRGARFQVEVIDPLAIVDGDTLCVTAIDSAGNRSGGCQAWPSTPDGKSPVFIGRIDQSTSAISGIATDNRTDDRGLGSIVLRNATNLSPLSATGLSGIASWPVSITVLDPTAPFAGELVITDLYGEMSGASESSIHTVVIPFERTSVNLSLGLPGLVEGSEQITAAIVATSRFSGDEVRTIEFKFRHTANGTLTGTGSTRLIGSFAARTSAGVVTATIVTKPGTEYNAGDSLATITFTTTVKDIYEIFHLDIEPGTTMINDGLEDTITVGPLGDPMPSQLFLGAPYVRIAADTMTVINGDCNRALTGDRALARPNGLAILGMYPHPVTGGDDRSVSIYTRNVPPTGATVRLFSVTGIEMASWNVAPSSAPVGEHALELPEHLSTGLYLMRIDGENGIDRATLLVD